MAVEFSWPMLGVIIPSGIISLIGYGYVFGIQKPRDLDDGFLIQVLLNMTWLSYALAVFSDPGSPPKNFKPRPNEMKRWCTKCQAYKPERAHHCRQCKKCILKMDHHCPWTMNCVGHHNMPHFIRFLIWVIVSTGYVCYSLCGVAKELYADRNQPAYLISKREIVFTVLLLPLSFFVFFSVGILFLRLFYNIVNGKTQIEDWEQDRVASLVRRKLIKKVEFPYDIDIFENIVNSWGSPIFWLIPCGPAVGDGLHFEKNEALDGGDVWPPDHIDQEPQSQSQSQNSSGSSSSGFGGSGPVTLGYMLSTRGSDNDFYRRDQWVNFEGERITDFGVDIESELVPLVESAKPSKLDSQDSSDDIPLAVLRDRHRLAKANATKNIPTSLP